MTLRVMAIIAALGAVWALWFGYGQLRLFRGTPFWDYRYIIYAVSAFVALSGLEWALRWIKTKIDGDQENH